MLWLPEWAQEDFLPVVMFYDIIMSSLIFEHIHGQPLSINTKSIPPISAHSACLPMLCRSIINEVGHRIFYKDITNTCAQFWFDSSTSAIVWWLHLESRLLRWQLIQLIQLQLVRVGLVDNKVYRVIRFDDTFEESNFKGDKAFDK